MYDGPISTTLPFYRVLICHYYELPWPWLIQYTILIFLLHRFNLNIFNFGSFHWLRVQQQVNQSILTRFNLERKTKFLIRSKKFHQELLLLLFIIHFIDPLLKFEINFIQKSNAKINNKLKRIGIVFGIRKGIYNFVILRIKHTILFWQYFAKLAQSFIGAPPLYVLFYVQTLFIVKIT